MNPDQESTPFTAGERQRQIRQLHHDLNTCLGVVATGLQALAGVREDASLFAELHATIETEGIQPLKQTIGRLVDVACREPEE